MGRKRFALALMIVVASACTSSTDAGKAPDASEPSIRSQLAEADATWAAAGVNSYRLEIQELRNYWTRGCQWTSLIADGVVIGSTAGVNADSNDCTVQDWTVELLHRRVTQMLDNLDEFSDPVFGEHTLEVSYNDEGVPTTIEFDLANGDDEESLLQVVFTPLP